MWPASLQYLTFGDYFHGAIDQVALLASLQQLTFGNRFQQVDRHGRVAVDRLDGKIYAKLSCWSDAGHTTPLIALLNFILNVSCWSDAGHTTMAIA